MPPLNPFNRTCLIVAIGQVLAHPSADAATVSVNTLSDTDGPSACTLREAIVSLQTENFVSTGCTYSNLLGVDDTINFNPGLYDQTIKLDQGTALYITKDLTINGLGMDHLTIDGSANNFKGIFYIKNATVNVNNLTITKGVSPSPGGGMRIVNGDVTINNCSVTDNRAVSMGFGGGLFISESVVTINDTSISGNYASGFGGGLHVQSSQVSIEGSTILGNTAKYSGGTNIVGASTVSLSNSTVSDNTASNAVGGIQVAFDSMLGMTNVTMSGNQAILTGGLRIKENGTADIVNSIISGNLSSFFGDEIFYSDSVINVDQSNLLGHSGIDNMKAFVISDFLGASDITATSDGSLPTSLGSIIDSLEFNGGPTKSHKLSDRSPAINAGNNSFCPERDQRGVSRSDGKCDIGSYELGSDDCYVINDASSQTIVFCL